MITGFIFDVDGVLVNSPHERAWGDTLRDLMENRWPGLIQATGYDARRYTSEVYQAHVAGKPRAQGAAALLAYFGIHDPDGARRDLLCEKKQEMIERLIDDGEFEAFDDALRFLLRARATGGLLAAASSSRNANQLMSRVDLAGFCAARGLAYDFVQPGASLLDVFDANVCGREFERGKPHPEIFLCAANMLGTPPEQSVVIEDAPSGVQAAKAGGMACVGVARNNDHDLLKDAGADWVVTSLEEIEPESIAKSR